jgi:Calcineurin-like phosphoesterase
MQHYDIIGDIHGHADLIELLRKMGYEERNGAWRHPERRVIFVGDFVDLGPKQVESVMIVRRMVDAGSALAIMGNHDFNAIAWYLPDPVNPGEYLRPHSEKNHKQHAAFLKEVEGKPEHGDIIDWFLELPLWLELSELRVIHACWHSPFMEYLAPMLRPGMRLTKDLMVDMTREPESQAEKDSPEASVFKAADALTKGLEIELPLGRSFLDLYGSRRTRVRVCWWNREATTYRTAALVGNELRQCLPDDPLPPNVRIQVPNDKPIFFGHYGMYGSTNVLSATIACVDYGVNRGGPLCCYRWQGESRLDAAHFCSVMCQA